MKPRIIYMILLATTYKDKRWLAKQNRTEYYETAKV